jgi:hypothetical protein
MCKKSEILDIGGPRLKQNLIFTMYENINVKWKKQDYDVRSYLKLVLNKFKIMKRITSICILLLTWFKETSMKISFGPPSKEPF